MRNCATRDDHHLFLRNGIWWLRKVVKVPGRKPRRIRISLHTRYFIEAKKMRDQALRHPNADLRFEKFGKQLAELKASDQLYNSDIDPIGKHLKKETIIFDQKILINF